MNGENPGDIALVLKDSGRSNEKAIYTATSSFGQGLTTTPIQMLQAYGALANQGVMMQPYIVDQVVKSNGYQEIHEPVEVGRPITSESAQTVAAMLVGVVDYGHSKKAAVDGYFMAGKTGTAQLPKENGVGYDANRHKDTYMGFGPVSDPRFVILVKMDEPNDVQFAEGSVVPIAGEISQYLMNYLKIPPDRE
jgi:cell division protein FtsI/penicillin-binding protein 2